MYVTFKNELKAGLGIALPKGKVRVYKKDDDAKEQEKQKDQKLHDDKLRLLELQGQGLLAGTKAYYDNRKAILDESMAKELEIPVIALLCIVHTSVR